MQFLRYPYFAFFLALLFLGTAAPAEAQLFWVDENRILSAPLDGAEREVLVGDAEAPRGLAFDAEGGFLYWGESVYERIMRTAIDGSSQEILVDDAGAPRGMELDLTAEKVYWADLRNEGAVMRANLDGSGVETLVSGDGATDGILDVALDLEASKMYWPITGGIMRANLDGSEVETVVEITSYVQPPTIAVAPEAGYVYWVESNSDVVMRASTRASAPEPEEVIEIDDMAGVTIDPATDGLYMLTAPYTAGGGGSIYRSALDGSDLEEVVPDLGFAQPALAVHNAGAETAVEEAGRPAALGLQEVYPNPFRQTLRATVEVGQPASVHVALYDVLGRRVQTLHDGPLPGGPTHHFAVDASSLPGGVYFLRATGSDFTTTRKVVRLR